jgi:hypothetical protein
MIGPLLIALNVFFAAMNFSVGNYIVGWACTSAVVFGLLMEIAK